MYQIHHVSNYSLLMRILPNVFGGLTVDSPRSGASSHGPGGCHVATSGHGLNSPGGGNFITTSPGEFGAKYWGCLLNVEKPLG